MRQEAYGPTREITHEHKLIPFKRLRVFILTIRARTVNALFTLSEVEWQISREPAETSSAFVARHRFALEFTSREILGHMPDTFSDMVSTMPHSIEILEIYR